jgi:YCII-related domain
MATFVIVNRAPKQYTPSADALAAFNAWFEQLGANLVDRGNPVFDSRALGNTGADTTLGGYTLIHADDLEAAIALAKGHPLLQQGGGVEVGELTVLNRGTRQLGDDPA